MTNMNAIVKPKTIEANAAQPQNGATTALAITPMEMLSIAVQQGADLDKLQKLMDLQERWERNEARKAFVAAMAEFKKNPPEITKNKQVSFGRGDNATSYSHATLDHVTAIVTRALSVHGLTHRWEVEQKEGRIRVTCVLTHQLGHSESVALESSSDTSGSKNSIQAIGSAVTYLQRYTLLSATGLAAKGDDNDAAGLGDFAEHVEWIQNAGDMDELQKLYRQAFKLATEQSNPKALKAIVAAKDARRKELL
jgi:ERF superfamily